MEDPTISYQNQPELSAEDVDLLAKCSLDTRLHSQVFFGEIFHSDYSRLHNAILEAIDSPHQKIVIAAPRGLGKTSTVLYGKASQQILFRNKRFVIYLTNSGDNAILQTENLKHELQSNILVRKMFGEIKLKYADNLDDRFSKKSWVAFGHTLVLPRGSGQQVRGLLYHARRPDLLIIDDLEDKENIQSVDQRKKLKEWFYSDVEKCISRYDRDWKFIYIDTLKHEDALLQELLDSPDWHGIRLDICDDNYNSNAPEFMSTEEIKKEVEILKAKGQLDVFYREMRNIPIAKETATFKPEYFRYADEEPDKLILYPDPKDKNKKIEVLKDDLVNVVIIDPAKEIQMQNDDSAVAGISVDRSSQAIIIRQMSSGKFLPDDLFKEAFKMVARIRALFIAAEVTSLHKFISEPLQNMMKVNNVIANYIELHAIGSKEGRVGMLAPYYKQGMIYHIKGQCDKLESQLLSFPRSKLWDEMDAVAYINKIIDENMLYFEPPDFDEDDYSDLKDEKPVRYRMAI